MSEAKTVNVAAAIFYKDNKILKLLVEQIWIMLAWEFPAERRGWRPWRPFASRNSGRAALCVQGAFFYDTVHLPYPHLDLHMGLLCLHARRV